jgi:hypothetical protein
MMLALAVSLMLPSPATGKVADIDLKDLVAESDLIVVGAVTRVEAAPVDFMDVEKHLRPVKIATARVVETWKGAVVQEVRFVASPTWTCDVTSAKEGEKLVLFLHRQANSPIMFVAHAGRGGMRLHDVKDKPYATVDDEVNLPKGTRTVSEKKTASMTLPVPSTEAGKRRSTTFTFTYEVRSIELGTLRALVRREVVEKTGGSERLALGQRP